MIVAKEYILKVLIKQKKLCEVMDVNQIYCDNFIIHAHIESLCFIPHIGQLYFNKTGKQKVQRQMQKENICKSYS